ncbi:Asp-tRNA(Asn)/Glu-tRNA(Gln) amidotransferase subunit GatB [Mesoterricola silvestris]|uniref:Aspartyl/glutamyl-tRNA(Asn/Gln) amidotransferase subunit B n=1 Tax=Mesoterricola silvestris TaxID=2927979 RepID=A0AA48KC66_9BACT|nr:Asp-tRNA(Asn)/Glu-tRNA(Gln) amidotransferase subunit GatB [Mesoterricola silvestris]BDU75037.1 aspartyl/glutamyl-tRNA(Asn/Gln) amidotransferase subunit B [Mesoterricola silvestris]
MNPGFEAVIGLEVHIQLSTRSKMFCACPNAHGGEPNSRTCPVCLGLPGALPALNAAAVSAALRLGLAVGAEIRPRSTFYRKQYFYPDLPKGYQITQGPVAIVENGHVTIPGDPAVRGVEGPVRAGIERAHLEEDAGKSTHEGPGGTSLVDLNRAGVPLLEIVGAPDLRSAQEASDYLKTLHRLVTFLGICDGNLEEGSFRADANISVRRPGEALGTRVEIKNLNSFRHVRLALDYEIARQAGALERGEPFPQETRGWDAERGETRSQRSKEAAMDYRYFPESDLPALVISEAEVAQARAALPELPEARCARFMAQYGLTAYEAGMLLQTPEFAAYFEETAGCCGNAKQAANWMLGEVSRTLNEGSGRIQDLPIPPALLGGLIALVAQGTINLNTAKEVVFPALVRGEGEPGQIVKDRGLAQVTERAPVVELVGRVLSAHPGQVAELRAGKAALRGFLVGQVMKAGKGKIDPRMVNEVLDEALGG